MALVDHTAAQAAEPGRLQGCWTTGRLPGGHWAALDGSRTHVGRCRRDTVDHRAEFMQAGSGTQAPWSATVEGRD